MSQPLDVPKPDEHLTMLGRLASTLSHEIRNPLGGCPRISIISSLNPGLVCRLHAQMGRCP